MRVNDENFRDSLCMPNYWKPRWNLWTVNNLGNSHYTRKMPPLGTLPWMARRPPTTTITPIEPARRPVQSEPQRSAFVVSSTPDLDSNPDEKAKIIHEKQYNSTCVHEETLTDKKSRLIQNGYTWKHYSWHIGRCLCGKNATEVFKSRYSPQPVQHMLKI